MPDDQPPRMQSGGIRLSWPQIVWGVSVVFFLGAIWQQMNDLAKGLEALKLEVRDSRISTYTKAELDIKEKLISAEFSRVWEHMKDLERVTFGREIPK